MGRFRLATRAMTLTPAAALAVMLTTGTIAEGAGTLPFGSGGNSGQPVVSATFDGFPEGFTSSVLIDAGIVFFGLDTRIPDDPPHPVFVIESTTSLAHLPGFTPPNVLAFGGGYVPGPGIGFGRLGEFRLTTGRLETHATLNFYGFANQSLTLLTLEAIRDGIVVSSDSTNLGGDGAIAHWSLEVSGVVFDELRVVSSGPDHQGTAFVDVDTVAIGNDALEPVTGCVETDLTDDQYDDCNVDIGLPLFSLELAPLAVEGSFVGAERLPLLRGSSSG